MDTPYLYTDFGSYLRGRLPYKVQKISLNAGIYVSDNMPD